MNHQTIMQNAEARRSVYALDHNLPLPPEEIAAIVRHALRYSPSPFNSHSVRLLVLFGAEHEKLWDIAADVLQSACRFTPTPSPCPPTKNSP